MPTTPAPESDSRVNLTHVIHARVRSLLQSAVGPERDRRLASCRVVFNGRVFAADRSSTDNLTGLLTADNSGATVQWPVPWRCRSNEMVLLSRADAVALSALMLHAVQSIYASSFALKDTTIPSVTYAAMLTFSVRDNIHWPPLTD